MTIEDIPKVVRKEAEKLMSRYRMIDAIVRSRKLEATPKLTASYELTGFQKNPGKHSETEKVALQNLEIEEYERIKKQLDIVYNSMKPIQQEIWEQRYILGRYDTEVYNDLNINEKKYYALKKEMIFVVAKALNLWQKKGIKTEEKWNECLNRN